MRMQDKVDKAVKYMQKVLICEGRDWISPTEIGREVGGHGKHSSYGSPICKAAVNAGLMERDDRGWYSLTVIDA